MFTKKRGYQRIRHSVLNAYLSGRRRRLGTLSSWQVDSWTGVVTSRKPSAKTQDLTSPFRQFQVVVGLEIHAQLQIPTKLFSPAPVMTTIRGGVNRHLHPFDVAVPGKLPQLSAPAVQKAVLAAAALHCTIPAVCRFERKHYAYADLPASYQITQQRWPLEVNGWIECSAADKKKKKKQPTAVPIRCRIDRIQLEQDTGKTTHTTSSDTTWSRVDFSRAGMALIEIVTAPDLRSSQQAATVVQTIRQLLQYTESCAGRMEEGQLRVDCNVNLQEVCDEKQTDEEVRAKRRSPRVEVKNLNSIKQVQEAIDYEARRQAAHWDELSREETRTWNAVQNETTLIRVKDGTEDYRFMPEPDLPPLSMDETEFFDGLTCEEFISQNLPELPAAARDRLQAVYGLSDYQARVIAGDPPAIRLFDTAMEVLASSNKDKKKHLAAATIFNLLCNELFALVKEYADDEHDATVKHSTVSGEQLGELAILVLEETISSTMAKKLMNLLYAEEQGRSPRQVAADRGFQLIANPDKLLDICRQVINEHPEELRVYQRGGKFVVKMHKLFTGKAMAASGGNAHPERLREALLEVLEEVAPGVTQ